MLNPELLLKAYRAGFFPMAANGVTGGSVDELVWLDPPFRGIIPLNEFHVPKRLARTYRQNLSRITKNKVFSIVIGACASVRAETWINAEIIRVYSDLHRQGHAHSIEIWEGDQVVGGLYGVAIGGAFFGESMFSTARDASKLCLVHLVEHLKEKGFTLLDTQFITDHLNQFGAIEIPREDYRVLLKDAVELDVSFV